MRRHLTVRRIHSLPAALVALLVGLCSYGCLIGLHALMDHEPWVSVVLSIYASSLYGLLAAPIVVPCLILYILVLQWTRLLNVVTLTVAGALLGAYLAPVTSMLHSMIFGSTAGVLGAWAAFVMLRHCAYEDQRAQAEPH